MKTPITHIRNWYFRYERPISSLSLVGGFVFDALTLQRVDSFWDNLWVVGHFVIIGTCIIVINFRENKRLAKSGGTAGGERAAERKIEEDRWHFWLILALQFFFGGLLSTFLVFYFRSGAWSVTWPFLLLLVAAFVANESFKKHYARLVFQISLFYVSLISFAIFIVPVLVHEIGPGIFLLSGAVSLLALGLFILCLRFFANETFKKSANLVRVSVAAIFVVTNILYFFNLIPPLPLSLKDGGIYHSLTHTAGGYTVTEEPGSWFDYFSFSQPFNEVAGNPVYAYSAVFSPALLDTTIIHEWQYYDTATSRWVTYGRIPLTIVGGRPGGYNTYSIEDNVAPGEWRVNVETQTGQIIGRLRFTVIAATATPPLITEIKS